MAITKAAQRETVAVLGDQTRRRVLPITPSSKPPIGYSAAWIKILWRSPELSFPRTKTLFFDFKCYAGSKLTDNAFLPDAL